MSLAKNSFATFICQVVSLALQFIIGVMTARYLGPEGKGLIYILSVSLILCTSLGSGGLGQASIYFIGQDRNRLPTIFGNLLVAAGLFSLVLAAVGWLFLHYGQPRAAAQFPLWVWSLVAVLIPIHLLASFLMQVLSAILRIKEVNIVEVTRVSVNLLSFILFVVILNQAIAGAFFAYALSWTIAAGGFFGLVLRYGGRPSRPNWPLLIASLRYGVKAYVSDLLGMLTLRLDALLVASLAAGGMQAAGIYSVATSLAELLRFIPVSIRLSLFPMVSSGDVAVSNRLTSAAFRHTLLLTVILALGLCLGGPFVIRRLYGEAFADAIVPLLLLLPGVIMLSLAIIFYSDLNGRGKPGATVVSTLVALIATVILDVILIPTYGLKGAALASSCAYTIEFVIAGSFFVYHSGLSWGRLFRFESSDLSAYLSLLPDMRKRIKLAE